jgi:hypothetical protein
MMIKNRLELKEAILAAENKKRLLQAELIDQYHLTTKSLTPGNLIKEGFNKFIQAPGAVDGIAKTAAGLGIGFLTKKVFFGKSTLISKLAMSALDLALAKTAVKNTDKIKAYGIAVYNNLFKKKSSADHELKT